MAEDQQLSPEEKLLKVIQEGGEEAEQHEAIAETVAPTAEVPADEFDPDEESANLAETLGVAPEELHGADEPPSPSIPEPAEKPRLKVARPEAPEAAGEAATAGAVVAPAGDADAESAATAAKPRSFLKKRSDPVQNTSAVNKCLIVALLLLIGLSGLEIWANVKVLAAERFKDAPLPAPNSDNREESDKSPGTVNLPSLEVMLSPFMQRSLFELPETGKPPEPPGPTPTPVIRAQLTLIGLTYDITDTGRKAQAIVMDNKINKMHFLTIGDTVGVDNRSLTLDEIQPDRVVFVEGKNRITVESGKSGGSNE